MIVAQTTPISELDAAGFFPKQDKSSPALPQDDKSSKQRKVRGGFSAFFGEEKQTREDRSKGNVQRGSGALPNGGGPSR